MCVALLIEIANGICQIFVRKLQFTALKRKYHFALTINSNLTSSIDLQMAKYHMTLAILVRNLISRRQFLSSGYVRYNELCKIHVRFGQKVAIYAAIH